MKDVTFCEKVISVCVWIAGFLVFVPTATAVYLWAHFRHTPRFERFTKAVGRIIVRSFGIRVNVRGREKLAPDATYLFVANHVNIFDVFVLFGHLPNVTRAIELEDHFSWPLYGRMINKLGIIPISQTNPRRAMLSLRRALRLMKHGMSMIILPEGGRTITGHFKPFQPGAFYLAKKSNCPVVPVVMNNAFHIKRKTNWLIRPGTMTLDIGTPLPPESFTDQSIEASRDLLHAKMTAMKIPESI